MEEDGSLSLRQWTVRMLQERIGIDVLTSRPCSESHGGSTVPPSLAATTCCATPMCAPSCRRCFEHDLGPSALFSVMGVPVRQTGSVEARGAEPWADVALPGLGTGGLWRRAQSCSVGAPSSAPPVGWRGRCDEWGEVGLRHVADEGAPVEDAGAELEADFSCRW